MTAWRRVWCHPALEEQVREIIATHTEKPEEYEVCADVEHPRHEVTTIWPGDYPSFEQAALAICIAINRDKGVIV